MLLMTGHHQFTPMINGLSVQYLEDTPKDVFNVYKMLTVDSVSLEVNPLATVSRSPTSLRTTLLMEHAEWRMIDSPGTQISVPPPQLYHGQSLSVLLLTSYPLLQVYNMLLY